MYTGGGTNRPVDPRFITGLSPIYHRDRERSSLLAFDQCTDAYCLCKPFLMQGMSGKNLFLWRRRTCSYPVQAQSDRNDMVVFPGHALHEKGLQGQKGVVPLFGSQKQSALLVPVINRS